MNEAAPETGIGLKDELDALLPPPLLDATTATTAPAKRDDTYGRAFDNAWQTGRRDAYPCAIAPPLYREVSPHSTVRRNLIQFRLFIDGAHCRAGGTVNQGPRAP